VRRDANPDNHREVLVTVTADGARKLRALADLHRRELAGMRRSLDLFRLERDSAAAKAAQRAAGEPPAAPPSAPLTELD